MPVRKRYELDMSLNGIPQLGTWVVSEVSCTKWTWAVLVQGCHVRFVQGKWRGQIPNLGVLFSLRLHNAETKDGELNWGFLMILWDLSASLRWCTYLNGYAPPKPLIRTRKYKATGRKRRRTFRSLRNWASKRSCYSGVLLGVLCVQGRRAIKFERGAGVVERAKSLHFMKLPSFCAVPHLFHTETAIS